MTAQPKSMFVAYAFWFFAGGIGGHRFYAGNIKSAFGLVGLFGLFLACAALTSALDARGHQDMAIYAGGLAVAVMAVWSVWILVDAFKIPGLIRQSQSRM